MQPLALWMYHSNVTLHQYLVSSYSSGPSVGVAQGPCAAFGSQAALEGKSATEPRSISGLGQVRRAWLGPSQKQLNGLASGAQSRGPCDVIYCDCTRAKRCLLIIVTEFELGYSQAVPWFKSPKGLLLTTALPIAALDTAGVAPSLGNLNTGWPN